MIRAQAGRFGVQTSDANVITWEQDEAVFWRDGREVARLPIRDVHALEVLHDAGSGMERTNQSHPRAYTPWTPEQDSTLLELAAHGTPVGDIAEQLGRQRGGISSRLRHLRFESGSDVPSG